MSKLQITPIGTCRIHAPLKKAAHRYPIEIDLARNYGYVHTSAEALQQLRFLAGEKEFAPEVLPLVFRDPSDADRIAAERWQPTDLHIVEISSAKSIRIRDDFVQVNYFYRRFADFFASAERSKTYWGLVRKGHQGRLTQYLRQQNSFKALAPADRELLVGVSIEQQSFKAIKADMAEIVERLGSDKVLFVTHVNALTADESTIPSRDRTIRWVKLAADQLGTPVFDPTPAMLDFGQDRALEKGGLDVTHYTPLFFDKVYEDLHRAHLGGQIEANAGPGADGDGDDGFVTIAANYEAMLELGDFFSTAREVHAAVDRAPDALPLVALRGTIRSRIGDFANAAADFARCSDEGMLSQPMRMALLEALSATGQHEQALATAEGLIADEFENPELFAAASTAAEEIGNIPAAVRFAKQAFRKDHSDLRAALHVLNLLSSHGNPEELADWRQEVLENAGGTSSGAFEICLWAIKNRDEALFTAGLRSVAELDKGGTIDLLEDALQADLVGAVADSVPMAVAIGRVSRSMAERRSALLERLLERADELGKEGRPELASRIATALIGLSDVSSSQIAGRQLAGKAVRQLRELTRDLRVSLRESYSRHDFEAVAKINEAAGGTLADDPASAIIAARSLFALDRKAEGLAIIKRAHRRAPGDFATTRWAARLAAMAGDYTAAIRLHGLLRTEFAEQSRAIGAEMDRFFSVAERIAPKHLRQLIEESRYDEASALADAMREELGQSERLDRELGRMARVLRMRLREIDEGEADISDREPVLRQMVRLRPDDEGMLRRLALELMRQFRFVEGAEIWERIVRINPNNESAERNLERCRRLALRRAPPVLSDAEASG